MKHVLLIGLLFLLLVGVATATVEIVDDPVVLDVDYGQFNDEDQTKITESGKVTIKNDAAEAITIDITFANLLSGYSAEDVEDVIINANSEQQVAFEIKVPHEEDAGEANIGEVQIKDASSDEVLVTKTLTQITKSMLELDELQVKYTRDNSQSESDKFNSDDEEYTLEEKVRPGTEVELIFELENLFDNDYDSDKNEIEDIILEIEIDDEDYLNEDFENEYDIESIEADKKGTFSLKFIVSEDADTDEFTLEFTIKAKDGEKSKYTIEKSLVLEVGREKDDLRIIKSDLSAEIVKCNGNVHLDVKLKNFGTREQRYSAIGIHNVELGIDENVNDIRIEEFSEDDNTWEQTFTFTIPEDAKAKSYPIEVIAFIKKDIKFDQETIFLVVEKCAEVVPETAPEVVPPQTDNTPLENQESTEVEDNKVTSSTIVKTVEDPYTTENVVMGLLIVAIVIILTFITMFTILLFRNDKKSG